MEGILYMCGIIYVKMGLDGICGFSGSLEITSDCVG